MPRSKKNDGPSDADKIEAALAYIDQFPNGGAHNFELSEVKKRLTGDYNFGFEAEELELPQNDGTQPESLTPEQADPDQADADKDKKDDENQGSAAAETE